MINFNLIHNDNTLFNLLCYLVVGDDLEIETISHALSAPIPEVKKQLSVAKHNKMIDESLNVSPVVETFITGELKIIELEQAKAILEKANVVRNLKNKAV